MVIGYHIIFSTYGFWLPNDPRGSWSTWIGSWELFRYGPATKTNTRRSVAGVQHDQAQREAAKEALKYEPVVMTGEQALAAAMGFKGRIEASDYRCYACAVMPEHVHMVVGRGRVSAEQMIGKIKQAASERLVAEGLHPFAALVSAGARPPTIWARKGWTCFLDSEADVVRAIRYVENNPVKEGLKRQRWTFVREWGT